MTAAKQYRWACPRCGSGVNAPSRLRRDDTRRYCLYCSEKTGRLVERECLVRKRKQAKAKAKRAVTAKAKRAATADDRKCKRQYALARARAHRESIAAAAERNARARALTTILRTEPDRALWAPVRITFFEEAIALGVPCAKSATAGGIYVPRWYMALRDHCTIHPPIKLPASLIRTILRDELLVDAVTAVAAIDPQAVLPYLIDNYTFPIPSGIKARAEALRK
jgi:hypothetical protein